MTKKLNLLPFSPENHINIEATIARGDNILNLNFTITGTIKDISFDKFSNSPERKWNLWEHTCFEMFIASTETSDYFEFNFSPSGNWNVFHLDDLRLGIKEHPHIRITIHPPLIETNSYSQSIEIVDQNEILKHYKQIGITAITKEKEVAKYWSILHPKKDIPDFHTRESFCLKL